MGPVAQSLESLKACFDARGAVDAGALAASPGHGRLAAALADLADFDPRRMRISAQLAFWLNVYNAAVVRDLLEFEAGEFFSRPRLRLAGHAWSLDDIEHGMLRGDLKKSDPRLALAPVTFDERAYFGLYRACRSSPPLRVYQAERLEDQLEEAARDFVRATVRVRDDGAKLKVPALFQWYAEDFGGPEGILEFVVARLDEASVELIDRRQGRVKIKYLDHDWSLNVLEAQR
jgi:hypothetical protein